MRSVLLSGMTVLWLVTATLPAQAGLLNASFDRVPQGTDVNLTEEGTLDWVHWGLVTEGDVNRKSGVIPKISNWELIWEYTNQLAWGVHWRETDHASGVSWSDGSPTLEVTNSTTMVVAYAWPTSSARAGFRITLPANPTLKRLRLYVGVFSGIAELSASLSDGSAPAYVDGSLSNLTDGQGAVYTIDFAADTLAQQLIVTWRLRSGMGPNIDEANVTLQAASLATLDGNIPPTVQFNTPTDLDQFTEGSAIDLTAEAADRDGSVSRVDFFAGQEKLGEATSSPFQMTWDNPTLGWHMLTARATDDQGTTSASLPVEVFVHRSDGELRGERTVPPNELNLTAEGMADWIHWGLNPDSLVNRKAEIPPQIGDLIFLGEDPPQRYDDNLTAFSWSDGTPTSNTAATTTGLFMPGLGGGFEVILPADTRARQVRIYAGLWRAQARFTAFLSDLSAAAYIDTSLSNANHSSYAVYTLDYRATSPNQTLTIRYQSQRVFDQAFGNVTLQAVTLSGDLIQPPAPVTLMNPVLNGDLISFTFLSETGQTYAVQFVDEINSGAQWHTSTNVAGTGEAVTVTQPRIGITKGFYRVETQ